MDGKPEAEIEISTDLVRELLAEQCSDLSGAPLSCVASGWDNVIYRLGETMAMRLPRRALAATLLGHEQRWLPLLAKQLPIAVPKPLRNGTPASAYPWPWSVVPWFEGSGADQAPPDGAAVEQVAQFLESLHVEAPAEAPDNPVRGQSLSVHAERMKARVARLESKNLRPAPSVLLAWEAGVAERLPTEKRWLHGDLHAQNILVKDGRISAIIDWGDLTAGDVATDLAVTWSLFEQQEDRQSFWELYRPDAATLARAKAWAAYFGIVLIDAGAINSPRHAAQGKTLLRRLAEDL
ncbi:MAG: aminoglycoside phosphotransferase family protein [Pseudomonadota bacterium]